MNDVISSIFSAVMMTWHAGHIAVFSAAQSVAPAKPWVRAGTQRHSSALKVCAVRSMPLHSPRCTATLPLSGSALPPPSPPQVRAAADATLNAGVVEAPPAGAAHPVALEEAGGGAQTPSSPLPPPRSVSRRLTG